MEALNKKLALLLWAETENGEDDVALFTGILVFENNSYIFKRSEPPHPIIDNDWLGRIQPVANDQLETLNNAEFVLSLSVGNIKGSDSSFKSFGLKWPL
jgi:hypothetical protein